MAVWAVALVMAIASGGCGRIGFGLTGNGGTSDAHADTNGTSGDTGSADSPDSFGALAHVTDFSSVPAAAGKTDSFTVTPAAAGDALVFAVGCAGSSVPTAASLTATGWTLTPLSGVLGTTTGPWVVLYGAIAPSTTASTFNVSWTVSNCQIGVAELVDEFSGNDQTGGTTTFDANNGTGGNTGCSTMIMTASANEAIWGACFSGAITAVGSGYTAAIQVGSREWSEYAIRSDPAGTVETVDMSSTGQGIMVAVAIRP
jgi:hypothetical protein